MIMMLETVVLRVFSYHGPGILNSYIYVTNLILFPSPAAPDSPDCCALILTLLSYLLIMVTLPISLCMCIKVFPQLLPC